MVLKKAELMAQLINHFLLYRIVIVWEHEQENIILNSLKFE